MSNSNNDSDIESPLLSASEKSPDEARMHAETHEKLRCTDEYTLELGFLRKTIHDLIQTLRLCSITATRWDAFSQSYLLPRHFDDIVEAALSAQLSIENGALNPARRELRYMLEVVVNTSYVDAIRAGDSFDQRVNYCRGKSVKKINVDHIFELPLILLGVHKECFAKSVQSAWVRASNYVHLTKKRIDEKLKLREQGVFLGMETIDMLKTIVSEVHEVCTIVILLVFETIGPSFSGNILVGFLSEADSWVFHASEFVAIADSYFDYKHERRRNLEQIITRRKDRIKYRATVTADAQQQQMQNRS